jgi:hypothetical protein
MIKIEGPVISAARASIRSRPLSGKSRARLGSFNISGCCFCGTADWHGWLDDNFELLLEVG